MTDQEKKKLTDTVISQEAEIKRLRQMKEVESERYHKEVRAQNDKINELNGVIRSGTYKTIVRVIALGVLILFMLGGGLYGCPIYNVWQKELAGKAELKQAEWNRQIKIQEANAIKESAKSLAAAEVERAKGVAKANEIIGNSLKNNEAYLRYLYIQGLQDKDNNIIYVPTEAGLPILEAGKRQ